MLQYLRPDNTLNVGLQDTEFTEDTLPCRITMPGQRCSSGISGFGPSYPQ
jgi:hypothetical protein